jgi:hypothetical protein
MERATQKSRSRKPRKFSAHFDPSRWHVECSRPGMQTTHVAPLLKLAPPRAAMSTRRLFTAALFIGFVSLAACSSTADEASPDSGPDSAGPVGSGDSGSSGMDGAAIAKRDGGEAADSSAVGPVSGGLCSSCDLDLECASDSSCVNLRSGSICAPNCTTNATCPTGTKCQHELDAEGVGQYRSVCAPPSQDCAGLTASCSSSAPYAAGATCTTSADCSCPLACIGGDVSLPDQAFPRTTNPTCLATCATSSDCPGITDTCSGSNGYMPVCLPNTCSDAVAAGSACTDVNPNDGRCIAFLAAAGGACVRGGTLAVGTTCSATAASVPHASASTLCVPGSLCDPSTHVCASTCVGTCASGTCKSYDFTFEGATVNAGLCEP